MALQAQVRAKGSMVFQFYGNGPYCYSNTTSMLLSSIGETVPPSLVEALSGVGLDAFWLPAAKLLFFSGLSSPPDVGISRALRILGFDFQEKFSGSKENPPFDALRSDLEESPAVLGPLDMGYLRHNPLSKRMMGSDHFVLAYGMDDVGVWVHDPEGFPNVRVPFKQMEQAWKAESIGYRRDYYRYWTGPKRVRSPSEGEIYQDALESFRAAYRESDQASRKMGWPIGRDAIHKLQEHIERGHEGRVTPGQRGFMAFFSLKLGARRALDYAGFFRQRDEGLAGLKLRQAKLFGQCQVGAVDRKWSGVGKALGELADVEEEFRQSLLG